MTDPLHRKSRRAPRFTMCGKPIAGRRIADDVGRVSCKACLTRMSETRFSDKPMQHAQKDAFQPDHLQVEYETKLFQARGGKIVQVEATATLEAINAETRRMILKRQSASMPANVRGLSNVGPEIAQKMSEFEI